jgi:GR25 family glycosyltransferase involved in LPS biosynthesis
MTAKKSFFNKFFNKIFVISLYDQNKKFEKVQKQFKNRGIEVEKFVAVDGRCKKEGDKACKDKIKSFEIMFDLKISNKNKLRLKELVPASSLTIGTILLLRKMVKENWDYILICEDDIELTRNLENKFKQGIKEINEKNYKWDLLYLGCGGNYCGSKGVSYKKTDKIKYLSEIAKMYDYEFFVEVKEDLRLPCDNPTYECSEIFSESLSHTYKAGGTWAYAYSLEGAKKVLKLIDNDAGNHIDQILKNNMGKTKKLIKALAFDPPIIYHEFGAVGGAPNSSIPWKW